MYHFHAILPLPVRWDERREWLCVDHGWRQTGPLGTTVLSVRDCWEPAWQKGREENGRFQGCVPSCPSDAWEDGGDTVSAGDGASSVYSLTPECSSSVSEHMLVGLLFRRWTGRALRFFSIRMINTCNRMPSQTAPSPETPASRTGPTGVVCFLAVPDARKT